MDIGFNSLWISLGSKDLENLGVPRENIIATGLPALECVALADSADFAAAFGPVFSFTYQETPKIAGPGVVFYPP